MTVAGSKTSFVEALEVVVASVSDINKGNPWKYFDIRAVDVGDKPVGRGFNSRWGRKIIY